MYPEITRLAKNTRIMLKLTQKEFGSLLGYSASYVCIWEKGEREVPMKVINYCLRENRYFLTPAVQENYKELQYMINNFL